MSGSSYNPETMLNRIWYGRSVFRFLLAPLSWLFALVAGLRRFCYRKGFLKRIRLPVAVVVVGNITVGGSGKTPVTLWLASALKSRGLRPAVISRGYGGTGAGDTVQVLSDSDPLVVGDEPLLLARRDVCPVFVDKNKVRAATHAIRGGANVIISDDGLQHYRLQRDAEIAVVDGVRGLGNGLLLPAGPLREPETRLARVDRILIQCNSEDTPSRYGNRANDRLITRFMLAGENLQRVSDNQIRAVGDFSGSTLHAVAGIGNPERFFQYLESFDIDVIRHPLSDHAEISAGDVDYGDDLAVVMTEKDAVKVQEFAHSRLWFLPVDVVIGEQESMRWLERLHSKLMPSTERTSA